MTLIIVRMWIVMVIAQWIPTIVVVDEYKRN